MLGASTLGACIVVIDVCVGSFSFDLFVRCSVERVSIVLPSVSWCFRLLNALVGDVCTSLAWADCALRWRGSVSLVVGSPCEPTVQSVHVCFGACLGSMLFGQCVRKSTICCMYNRGDRVFTVHVGESFVHHLYD